MNVKTIFVAAALTAASTVSAYAGCAYHKQQAMSCAEGMTYDSESQSCVPVTTS
ncbi:MAG: chitin-binding domain-containing protein [Roseovarius sp.]